MSEKSKSSPLLKAYAISIASFFVLCWIGSAFITEDTELNSPGMIAALVFFGLTCWSPSVGLIMFKKWIYGMLSGFGRLGIIVACGLTDRQMLASMPEGQGHAYLTFMGILIAFTWGVVDFVVLYFVHEKQKKEQLI